MPRAFKIIYMMSERSNRSLGFLNLNGLYKNFRVDYHFDDYQRIKEIT